jgi:AGZA family xanthine/uracil permease-like MFS transporter
VFSWQSSSGDHAREFGILERHFDIDGRDPTEYAPAVVTTLGMPLTYSIATGIGLGLITYAAVKLLSGRFARVSRAVLLIGAVFVLHFALT